MRLAGHLEGADEPRLGPDASRRLLTALVRQYARRAALDQAPPIDASVLTTDEVAVTVAAMMRGMDITSFELAALFNV